MLANYREHIAEEHHTSFGRPVDVT